MFDRDIALKMINEMPPLEKNKAMHEVEVMYNKYVMSSPLSMDEKTYLITTCPIDLKFSNIFDIAIDKNNKYQSPIFPNNILLQLKSEYEKDNSNVA